MTHQNTSNINRQVVRRAAVIVAVAFLLSRVLGLVRVSLFGFYFGADTLEARAFEAANRIPEAVFIIIAGGALGSAFIPKFAELFERGDEGGAWRLFSAVLNLLILVLIGICGLGFIFAQPLAENLLQAQPAELGIGLPLTVDLMRIMFVATGIFGVSGLVMATLNARQHFTMPAIAPSMFHLGVIGGIVLFAPDVMGTAYGWVLGALAHLVCQIPMLVKKGVHYQPLFSVRDKDVQEVMRLMGPRMLGLSFSEINLYILTVLAIPLAIGSQVFIARAFQLVKLPYGVIGQAMGTAAFPTLAAVAARRDWAEMQRIISDALRTILFLGIPATAGMILLRVPLVALLYQYGAFSTDDTLNVSVALLFYTLIIVPLAALEVISRSFYAMKDTWTPVYAGGLQVLALLGLIWLFTNWLFPALGWEAFSFGGLALGHSLSNGVEVLVLLWLLRRRLGGLNGRYLLDGAWRTTGATLVMVAVLYPLLTWGLPALPLLIQLAIGGLIGLLAYAGGCLIFRVAEFEQGVATVKRRLMRMKN